MSGVKCHDSTPSAERGDSDLSFIGLALRLAEEGKGEVSPNPLVGAVVVKGGRVVGRGVHRYATLKHAEILALEDAGESARGATLYTNLEPCSHHGRTPPCTEAILRAGITRVVASMPDPNPRVAGHGFELLRQSGIETEAGPGQKWAERLNEKFIRYITTARPFVHLKTAISLNGRIAARNDRPTALTGDPARAAVHSMRHEFDAILVGVGTVLADDPLLTCRSGRTRRRPLYRVVLDARGRLPLKSRLVATAPESPVLVFTGPATDVDRKQALVRAGVAVIDAPLAGAGIELNFVLEELGRLEITSLIVEGGSRVNGSFLSGGLVDKISFFISPVIITGAQSVPFCEPPEPSGSALMLGLRDLQVNRWGDDTEVTGYPEAGTADASS